MQQKLLPDLLYPPVGRGAERGRPFPLPAGSSPRSGSTGCEPEERSLRSPLGAAARPSAPFLPFSSAGSDCSSLKKLGSPSPSALPCPGSAACNPPHPSHLASLGIGRPAPFLPPSRSLCMAASARPSYIRNVRGLVQKRPTFAGLWVPCSTISE